MNALLITNYPGRDILSEMEENFAEYLRNPDLVKEILLQLIDVVNFLHNVRVFEVISFCLGGRQDYFTAAE
jgi:hypothetical protein